ncbi:anthranilate synthase component I family protein [Mucilaginibacter sp.]|uniref:anthranilate synthase component I family protein n=1 Tax=Mucilaginibacter sp. TaxID=1882438 RepID=UPI003B005FD8
MIKEASLININLFKRKALHWASSFNTVSVFDSNNFNDPYSDFDWMLAAGSLDELEVDANASFIHLKSFRQKYPNQWLPGFLSYDLKNEVENLTSENPDYLHFPQLYFFVPKHVLLLKNNQLEIISTEAEKTWFEIEATKIHLIKKASLQIKAKISKEEYLGKVNQIKQHILRGNIYETNFCQEFYAENAQIDPISVFEELNAVSPTPFACYFKVKDKHVISASPERFLAKRNQRLISQPIKGTAPRSPDPQQDEHQKNTLKNSIKEKAENVMIVDLVRNDLTKSALPGTVEAEELFGVYSFRQVHQMISTVSATLDERIDPVDAIKNTFPPGSMTGAPKIKAMQLAEYFEVSKRSVYAGSAGYFSPGGDFDFNVIIRTILYNAAKKYLSFQVGSAITFQSEAAAEYEECLLKASAMMQVLS